MQLKIELLTQKFIKCLDQAGFELGTSDYQTDALDHSASLEDI